MDTQSCRQGKIASIVTYLEMCSPPSAAPPFHNPAWLLRLHSQPDLEWYRELFRNVGDEWLWFSRLQLDDDALRAIVHHPAVDVFALEVNGMEKGIVELDRRSMPDIEITFNGLTADMVGQGAGHFLMERALEHAWSHKPTRVIVHTCTLDHPRAMGFYLKTGFVPYKRALELADDPHWTALFARRRHPHFPVLREK